MIMTLILDLNTTAEQKQITVFIHTEIQQVRISLWVIALIPALPVIVTVCRYFYGRSPMQKNNPGNPWTPYTWLNAAWAQYRK